MKICQKCVLPETYPGISFDASGICNICREQAAEEEKNRKQHFSDETELLACLEKYRGLHEKYDVLVPVSGGVDSCYALINIVETFKLRPLVFHNDHGYEDDAAVENAGKLCRVLDVDMILSQYELGFMRKLFKYFNRVSEKHVSACHVCGNMLYFNALEMARRFDIKLVINGYSKGQAAFMADQAGARQKFEHMLEIAAGDREFIASLMNKYELLQHQEMFLSRRDLEKKPDPGKILVIPFYIFKFYKTDKETLKKACIRRFDWQPIEDSYPARTTNCRMIWLNTYVDLKQDGYSQYQEEYSTMVRAGDYTRDQALADLTFEPPEGLLEELARSIDLDLEGVDRHQETKPPDPRKILLAVAPFWTPLIPPMGISALKNFLQKHGYEVKTAAVNNEQEFVNLYNCYFDTLKSYVPEEKHGNFYSIGHFVLQNHMMAHGNYDYNDESLYLELVKVLVHETYYIWISDDRARELCAVLDKVYTGLRRYFTALLAGENPAVLGLTANKSTLPASMFVFKLTREKFPHIKTVMGGPVFADHLAVGSPNYDYFLEKTRPYIDKIIIGQGELMFLNYLEDRLPASQRVYTKDDVGGVILDFASLDIPDLSDYDIKAFPYLPAAGSISCDYQCSFCSQTNYFGEFRKKDPAQTVREMETLYKKYRRQLFFMTDSGMNPIITPLAEEFTRRDLSLYWDGYLRVDEAACDINNTLQWRRGGFYRARLGVESGSPHVLELMNKKITVQQIRGTISSLAYAGIKTTAYWLVGHPGETEEDFQQTLALLEELKDDIWQAECAQFDYYYLGQTDSLKWGDKRQPVYPEKYHDLLLIRTWKLDLEPSREAAYDRLFRFVRRCKKLGIPNPYSLQEIAAADDRWKKLHKNAVPPLLELQNASYYIEENKNIQPPVLVQSSSSFQDDGDFNF